MKFRFQGRVVDASPTMLDRVVGYFNPRRGVERMGARAMLALAGGYESGQRDKRSMRKWRPAAKSGNTDTLGDLSDLRGRSRDLVRNNPLATGAIQTTTVNVVGDGLQLRSRIDRELLNLSEDEAAAWQKTAEREFEEFCRTCDFAAAQSFWEMQQLAFRSVLESGDLLVVRKWRAPSRSEVYGTRVQLVESDRLCNPDRKMDTASMAGGVEIGANGQAKAFHVASRHPDDFGVGPLTWQAQPARDAASGDVIAFLLAERLRPDLVRGVPYLAPVIETLKKIGDYTDYEATAALISAMFTVFVTNADSGDDVPVVGTDDPSPVIDRRKEIALEDAGAIVELGSGQDVKIANPGRPNEAFDGFVMALCRQVGAALGIGHEMLVKHFTASYSASRASLEMAWQFFRVKRSWLAWNFCQVIYEWAIEEAIARGRIEAAGFFEDPLIRQAWLRSRWNGPVRINLDPKKESDADKQDIELGVRTRQDVIDERTGGSGSDFDTVTEQLGREKAARERAGLGGSVDPPPAQPGMTDPQPDQNDQQDAQT
ncbi:phage portal protein [Kaistia algarum]|uniref:phage portal protein n=1 Tax=Kaistia algarum TaxID=2083279 RepID=UPI000CE88436|nr:phage portal protein [Kaistia algarum]MCX5513429.1 phage portal protein [Kaistia algarum]PPE77435.1 phage portal protein [Kaistia algarum]